MAIGRSAALNLRRQAEEAGGWRWQRREMGASQPPRFNCPAEGMGGKHCLEEGQMLCVVWQKYGVKCHASVSHSVRERCVKAKRQKGEMRRVLGGGA